MADFFRTNPSADDSFIRGAARLMIRSITTDFPSSIGQVVNLSTYDAMNNWADLGATKTGIQITVNNTEETFDVDQISGDIEVRPNDWECSVGTQLAEMTLERLTTAWQMGSSGVAGVITTSGTERVVGFGQPTSYNNAQLAVLFQRASGKIRAFLFRKVTRLAAESAVTFNKTGEQISIPVRFRALPDTSIVDVYARFFQIRDQL